MNRINVAVDGPAGAGKSSVSKAVAKAFGYIYVDTGAMYRAIALKCIKNGFSYKNDVDKIIDMLDTTNVDIKYVNGTQHIYLDGDDVSDYIRTQEVSDAASGVAVIPEVRLKLVELQRELAQNNNVIMDGRDIGTYVLPDANIKIFLTASSEERARRRCLDYENSGIPYDFETVKADIEQRDYNDSHREFAPLRQADDAMLINTDGISFSEVVELISTVIKEKSNVL